MAAISARVAEANDRIGEAKTIARTLSGTAELEPIHLTRSSETSPHGSKKTYDVRVRTDLPETAVVTANEGLRSVVDNLLENAGEHNDRDDPLVGVELERTADVVRLIVRDDGPGVPDEQNEALFESAGDGSIGGFQIVRTLVDAYGGEIRVEENDPRGSVFVVGVPPTDVRG